MIRLVAGIVVACLLSVAAFAQSTPARSFGGRPSISIGPNPGQAPSVNDRRFGDTANVLTYGADPTGVTASDIAFASAAATGKDPLVPTGSYHLTQMLTLTGGQTLQCMGKGVSLITIGSDFAPAAPGVIELLGSELGTGVENCGIVFSQPVTQSSRASFLTLAGGCTVTSGGTGCKYPPAIYAPGTTRVTLRHDRISSAWDGIALPGNTGGFLLDDLEIGALDIGLAFDGGSDFCKGVNLEFWPFGMSSGNILTGVYQDGNTIAAQIGLCTSTVFANFATFNGRVQILSDASWNSFANLELDGDHANLQIAGGDNLISGLYSSKSATHTDNPIGVTGGSTQITNYNLLDGGTAPIVTVNGGSLDMQQGDVTYNGYATTLYQVASGLLRVDDAKVHQYPGTRTAPVISQTGGTLIATGNKIDSQTGSAISGPAISVASDNAANRIAGNDWGGLTVSLPTNAVAGTYGPNKTASFTFTPVLNFSGGNGTFAPTFTTQAGTYHYTGSSIEEDIALTFSTNAYSGASGVLLIGGQPISAYPTGATGKPSATVIQSSSVSLNTGFTEVRAVMDNPTVQIVMEESGSGQVQAILSPQSFPASTAGISLVIHVSIPTN